MLKLPQVKISDSFTAYSGGMDTDTPAMLKKPGTVSLSRNIYQSPNKGYTTFRGYERYDGQTKPSSAEYAILLVSLSASVTTGNIVTDDAGTSYGTVIAVAQEYLVLAKITGTFTTGNIKVSSSVVGTCTGGQVINGSSDQRLSAYYKSLAADLYRSDITDVTGSGDILGIWYYDGDWYAFRNATDGKTEKMYKDSVSGWVEVDLGYELSFTSGGTYEIVDGDTITGASGHADVTRVVLESGTWAAGTAAGKLIIASQTGTFAAENIDVGANSNVATIAGESSAITFANPSGTFEFVNTNLTGGINTFRMYGVDRVNRGFEFDGTVFVPLKSPMVNDTPDHITEHEYYLFYAFGGDVVYSGLGNPYQQEVVTGAGQIALGDEITGFAPQLGTSTSGAALAIYTEKTHAVLYGTDSSDWSLVHQRSGGVGAIDGSLQVIENTFSLNSLGITKLSTTNAYGNFLETTVSQNIKSWLDGKKNILVTSCVIKEKMLYCLFFSDNTALFCTVKGGEIVSMMPMIFPHKVTCICVAEDSSGKERVMFGSDDGYVREMFVGTSMDGDDVDWFCDLSYDSLKSPNIVKKFRKYTMEISGEAYSEFMMSYKLSYNSALVNQPGNSLTFVPFAPSMWDEMTWDEFYWDGTNLTPMYFKLNGSGTNISITLKGRGNYFSPLTFTGGMTQYTLNREVR